SPAQVGAESAQVRSVPAEPAAASLPARRSNTSLVRRILLPLGRNAAARPARPGAGAAPGPPAGRAAGAAAPPRSGRPPEGDAVARGPEIPAGDAAPAPAHPQVGLPGTAPPS